MSFFKVTLKRSLIGLPQKTKLTAEALGVGSKRTGRTVYKTINPSNAGLILKLKELVDVEIVDEAKTQAEISASRKSNPGFVVERKNNSTTDQSVWSHEKKKIKKVCT